MSRLFRGKFLAGIKEAFEKGELKCLGKLQCIRNLRDMNHYLRPLYKKDWIVYAKPPFGGPEHVIGYLGRYTHRVAISNHRLLKAENGQVSFAYKDYADQNKRKVMAVDADEFIRRFLLHILPSGFHKIRYYGLLATRNRKTKLARARKLLGQKPLKHAPKQDWQELFEQLTGINPLECPCCKEGSMKTILTFEPRSRAPPSVGQNHQTHI